MQVYIVSVWWSLTKWWHREEFCMKRWITSVISTSVKAKSIIEITIYIYNVCRRRGANIGHHLPALVPSRFLAAIASASIERQQSITSQCHRTSPYRIGHAAVLLLAEISVPSLYLEPGSYDNLLPPNLAWLLRPVGPRGLLRQYSQLHGTL